MMEPTAGYEEIYVTHVSLQNLEEAGWELGDGGLEEEKMQAELNSHWLISCLTNRQRKVAAFLTDGFTRKETAKQLGVCLQAIHQIVLRMRKRLKLKAQIR